jgi:hypothetical protein
MGGEVRAERSTFLTPASELLINNGNCHNNMQRPRHFAELKVLESDTVDSTEKIGRDVIGATCCGICPRGLLVWKQTDPPMVA